jgi:predicted anti-sigma-YlaC factor YlaD
MRCGDVKERLSAYLDRELEPALEGPVREHLDRCGTCRDDLAELQGLDMRLQALPKVRMYPEFAEALTVRVCKDSLAADRSRLGLAGLFAGLTSLLETLFDLGEASRSPRTLSLDEFSDFPPLSMGYVYCRLLGQCRGD